LKHLTNTEKFESNEIILVTASESFIKIFNILNYTIGELYKKQRYNIIYIIKIINDG